jgi:hypothetical protein
MRNASASLSKRPLRSSVRGSNYAEGRVNDQLTDAYRRLKQLEHESDASVREQILDEVIKRLNEISPLLSRARVIMRLNLGVIDKPPS